MKRFLENLAIVLINVVCFLILLFVIAFIIVWCDYNSHGYFNP